MSISSVTPSPTFNSIRVPKAIILLVEDESTVRQVTRQVLEHAGYEVLESDGAREALRLATEHRGHIGLLLSDVVMPGMSGLDLARHIREMQPRLTTVFMSGYAETAVLHQSVQDPLSSYIQKPFTIDLLLACVDKALAKSSAATAQGEGRAYRIFRPEGAIKA